MLKEKFKECAYKLKNKINWFSKNNIKLFKIIEY